MAGAATGRRYESVFSPVGIDARRVAAATRTATAPGSGRGVDVPLWVRRSSVGDVRVRWVVGVDGVGRVMQIVTERMRGRSSAWKSGVETGEVEAEVEDMAGWLAGRLAVDQVCAGLIVLWLILVNCGSINCWTSKQGWCGGVLLLAACAWQWLCS